MFLQIMEANAAHWTLLIMVLCFNLSCANGQSLKRVEEKLQPL